MSMSLVSEWQMNVDELKELSGRLTGLLDDPQPDLYTWLHALSEVLLELYEWDDRNGATS